MMPASAMAIVFAQLAASSRADLVVIEVVGDGCPSGAELRGEAERRLGDRPDPSRVLAVRVKPSSAGFSGTVDVVDRNNGATIASRTVEGATCEGVANAALLLVSLGSTDGHEAAAPPPTTTTTRSEGDRATANDQPSTEPTSTQSSSPSRTHSAFHATALSAFVGGAGPVAVGGGVRIAGAKEGAGLFRPEVALGFEGFVNATIARERGHATRSLIAGRADICPLGIGPQSVVIRVCASGALGEIRVRGDELVPRTKDEGRLYATLGGSVRARARIAWGIGIEIAAGWLAPLQSHRFYFEPNETVVALAPAPFAEGGLSWSIP